MKRNKIPKTIQKWLDSHPDIVDEYWLEADGFGEPEGHDYSIWVYFKPGWISWMNEVHHIHEIKVVDFLSQTRYIQKCDCEQCKS